ncbi:hypothetical protein GCM10022286_23820 [Gryllotalpicola daejeonensis]|jgi:hypothetical protein|uniref:Uncharacterized protein n=1 Tax=Gryllotalpicola daejeonensis TaxID=993087 RepID=A0ABP7ZLS1_9MICO
MSDDSEIEQNVVTAVISPGDILSEKPDSVPEGHYLARLADSGVGSPSYVVVPLRNGAPAERIAIGDGEQYHRTVTQSDEVLYRARGNEGTTAWTSSTE